MDSGNSGSMQSSSCGDEIEEYDSRAESSNFSAFLNHPLPTPPTTTTIETIAQTGARNNQVINNLHHNQMFDPLPNYYMDSLHKQSTSSSSNPNSFLNLDMIWSKATARSEPNNTDLSSLLVPSSSSSSSSHQNQQAFLLSQFVGQNRENVASVPTTHHYHQQQHHSLPLETTSRGGSLTNDHQDLIINNNNNNVHQPGRNPKKRSRASRRAPTTVLTTDTTNFRAMVQEFTGIPAPPFSSPFPRTRLDLFGSSVASRSMSNHMDPPQPPPPPYLLRPFAQKIQTFSPLIQSSSSSMMENLASTNSPSINYHLSQQNNLPLMQHNQILGFQSISQTPTKYPHGTQQPSLETTPNVDSRIKMSTVFDELGLSHANVNNNSNNVNIGVLHHHNTNNNMVTNTTTTTSSDGANNNTENQWSQRTNDFGAEKVQECVVVGTTTRGEGTTVESWINCSSSD
ncbi:hypothetical protein RYX36_014752 [Vicia faba]